MKKEFHKGVIGIPQADGKNKIASYHLKSEIKKSEKGINGGKITYLKLEVDNTIAGVYYNGEWEIEIDENDQSAMVAYYICLKDYN